MFPRLTIWQWAIALAFLAFYGFTVFALTRDYYLRNPPRPVAATTLPNTSNAALGQQLHAAARDTGGDIPLELMTSDPVLLSREADRLFAAQRFTDAAALYRKSLELDPNDAGSSNDLGLALHYAGQSAAGLEVLRTGAGQAPGFQRIWLSLGFVAMQAGRQEQAREALTKAKGLDPTSDIGVEADRLLGMLEPRQPAAANGAQ